MKNQLPLLAVLVAVGSLMNAVVLDVDSRVEVAPVVHNVPVVEAVLETATAMVDGFVVNRTLVDRAVVEVAGVVPSVDGVFALSMLNDGVGVQLEVV